MIAFSFLISTGWSSSITFLHISSLCGILVLWNISVYKGGRGASTGTGLFQCLRQMYLEDWAFGLLLYFTHPLHLRWIICFQLFPVAKMWFFVVARTALSKFRKFWCPLLAPVFALWPLCKNSLRFWPMKIRECQKMTKEVSPYTVIWLCRNVFLFLSQLLLSHFQNFWAIYIFMFIAWTKFFQFDWNWRCSGLGFFPCSQTTFLENWKFPV